MSLVRFRGGSDTDSTTNDLAPSSASTKPAPTVAKVTNIPPLKQLKEELRAATKKRKELAGELEAKNNKISNLLPAAKSALLNRQEGNDGKWVTNYLELKRIYEKLRSNYQATNEIPGNRRISNWASQQRKLTGDDGKDLVKISLLNDIGFHWEV